MSRLSYILAGRAGAGICAAALAGCTASPRLDVVDTRVIERTEDGVLVEFLIEGRNDNTSELPLRFVRYSLELDGVRVFHGERSAEATLRRSGAQRFTLPVAIRLGEGATTGTHGYRLSGEVEYVATDRISELLFDMGAHRPRASFSDSGTIELGGGGD